MTRHIFLILIIFIIISCTRNNQVQKNLIAKECCLDELLFNSNYGTFSPPAIRITLLNCDSAFIDSIESVVFPDIPVKDTLFYDFDLGIVRQVSPDTTVLIVGTYYFLKSSLSKDSIEHLLLKKVGLITTRKDTIYVERCPEDPVL